MEASVLREPGSTTVTLLKDPRAGFLRLQSDERLVALTRRGNDAAFETLIGRYRARLLAFCRHMVGSTEDAEDILQEVFVSAYRAMLADDRELNVRPWLYRIARNRSLNHLRRPRPSGVDSMDIFEGGAAVATAERVHDKMDLEDLVEDVKRLPETQRTALMLREMGDLSYDQIAEAMDTSIPSVKSLLVRARVSLAEAAESRRLSCEEVRLELGAVAEGLQKLSPPARRHIGDCDRCRAFKKELSTTNRKLAILAPVGGIVMLKNIIALKLTGGATAGGAATGGGAAAAGSAAAGGAAAAGSAVAGSGAAGITTGIGAVIAKVGTGLVAAALVTGGVAQVATHGNGGTERVARQATAASAAPAAAASSGGAAPEPVVAATPEPKAADAAQQVETTAKPDSSPAADSAPASEPKTDSGAPGQVVDEETTTVVAPGDDTVAEPPSEPAPPTDGGGSTSETPGMPTAPPETSPPSAPPAQSPDGTAAGSIRAGGATSGGTAP